MGGGFIPPSTSLLVRHWLIRCVPRNVWVDGKRFVINRLVTRVKTYVRCKYYATIFDCFAISIKIRIKVLLRRKRPLVVPRCRFTPNAPRPILSAPTGLSIRTSDARFGGLLHFEMLIEKCTFTFTPVDFKYNEQWDSWRNPWRSDSSRFFLYDGQGLGFTHDCGPNVR